MGKEKTISIEPYINQGGQLGEKIELNRPVAQAFMRRADIRRNVVVQKGEGLPQATTVVMSDELAFKGTLDPRQLLSTKVASRPHYEVTRQPDRWVIDVHDRLLDDSIRRSKKRPDNQGYYEDEFIRRINKALRGGLHDSLWQEKREMAREALNVHFKNLVHTGVFASSGFLALYLGDGAASDFAEFVRNADPTEVNSAMWISLRGSLAFTLFGLSLGVVGERVSSVTEKFEEDSQKKLTLWKNRREALIPPIPITSATLGNIHLMRHGGRLVKKV